MRLSCQRTGATPQALEGAFFVYGRSGRIAKVHACPLIKLVRAGDTKSESDKSV